MKFLGFTWIVLSLGCNVQPQNDSDTRGSGAQSADAGEGKTEIVLTLPDREALEDEVDDIEETINSYYLKVWTLDGSCDYPTSTERSGPYSDNGKIWAESEIGKGSQC